MLQHEVNFIVYPPQITTLTILELTSCEAINLQSETSYPLLCDSDSLAIDRLTADRRLCLLDNIVIIKWGAGRILEIFEDFRHVGINLSA
jgi:hypothetical protein